MKKSRFAGLKVTTDTPARTASVAAAPPARRSRPPGRSADRENFRQATVYLNVEAYKAAKMRLVKEDRQLSEVVGKLLDVWLANNVDV
jgi:hypothetical protein